MSIMCIKNTGGISGYVRPVLNTARQGQCSRCLMAIYPGMPCGIEDGNLVCCSRVSEQKLSVRRYSMILLGELSSTQVS